MKVTKATAYALHAMMYMVRHITQLPITASIIARAEEISPGYLAKIFQQLAKARFVKAVKGKNRGYVFARPPEEISMLELVKIFEGGHLFDDCFFRHCECGGTPQNCLIYSKWYSATKKIYKLLEETSISEAAWNHPEHRFNRMPENPKPSKPRKMGKKGRA